jgi:putative protease
LLLINKLKNMATSKKTAKKSSPKAAPKTTCCEKAVEGKLIGKITHYFSNIEVAVVDLTAPLKVGDTIRIVGGQETDFEQEVASMQIEHEEVKSAKKGDAVGMKVKEKVHEGYKVYKI